MSLTFYDWNNYVEDGTGRSGTIDWTSPSTLSGQPSQILVEALWKAAQERYAILSSVKPDFNELQKPIKRSMTGGYDLYSLVWGLVPTLTPLEGGYPAIIKSEESMIFNASRFLDDKYINKTVMQSRIGYTYDTTKVQINTPLFAILAHELYLVLQNITKIKADNGIGSGHAFYKWGYSNISFADAESKFLTALWTDKGEIEYHTGGTEQIYNYIHRYAPYNEWSIIRQYTSSPKIRRQGSSYIRKWQGSFQFQTSIGWWTDPLETRQFECPEYPAYTPLFEADPYYTLDSSWVSPIVDADHYEFPFIFGNLNEANNITNPVIPPGYDYANCGYSLGRITALYNFAVPGGFIFQ